MPRAPIFAASGTLASALAWAGVLTFGNTWLANDAAVLLGLALLVASTISVVGLTISRSRWARRLALFLLVGQVLLFATVALGWASALSLMITAIAIGAVASPWLSRWVAVSPRLDAPPATAVLLVIGLVLAPAVIAVAFSAGLTPRLWALAVASWIGAWAYGRAIAAALWSLRVASVPVAVAAVIPSGIVGIVVVGYAVALCGMSWTRDARIASQPAPRGSGSAFPIPAELTPEEILSAAGLDRGGRRHEPRRSP